VAPLGSISVVANVVVAPMILGEVPTRRDVMATGLIVAGCAVAVSFAAHKDHLFTAPQLFALYLKPNFYVYFTVVVVIVLVWLLAIRWMEVIQATRGSKSKAYRRVFKCHRLSYAAISGIAGAQSVLFAKTTVELVTDAIAGGGAAFLTFVPTYAVILAMACTITLQIYWLNCGLARWDALYNVPIFSSFWILCTVIGGGVFYDEFADFSALQGLLFPLGVLLAIAGVYWLSQREANEGDSPVDDTGWSGRTKLLEGDEAEFVAKAKATIRTAQVLFTGKHLGLGLMRLSAKLVDVSNPRRSRVAQVWAVWSMTSEAAEAIAAACGSSRRVRPGDLLIAVNGDSLLDRWTSHTDAMRRIMNTARPVRLGFRILSNAQRRRVLHGRMSTFASDRPLLHGAIAPPTHSQAAAAAAAAAAEDDDDDDNEEYNIKSKPSREGEREWSASFAAGATVESSVTQARHAAELSSTYTPASGMASRGAAVEGGPQRGRASSGARSFGGSPPRKRAGTAVAALGGSGGASSGDDEMVVAAAAVNIGLLLGQRAADEDDGNGDDDEDDDASASLLPKAPRQPASVRSRQPAPSAFRTTDEAKTSLLRAAGAAGGYGTLGGPSSALTHHEGAAVRAAEVAQDSDDPDCGILEGWGRGGEFDDASSKISGASPARKLSSYQRPSLRLSDAGLEGSGAGGAGGPRAAGRRRRARVGSASGSAIGAPDAGTSVWGSGRDGYVVALYVDDGRLATSAARGIRTAHHALRNVVMDPMMGVFHIGGLVAPFAIFSRETEDEEAGADAGSGGEHPLASLMDRLFPTEGRQWNSLDRLLETLGVGDDDEDEEEAALGGGAVSGSKGADATGVSVPVSGRRAHSPLIDTLPSGAAAAAWSTHRSVSDYKVSSDASLAALRPAQSRRAMAIASRQRRARKTEAIRRVASAIERVGLRTASPESDSGQWAAAVYVSQSPKDSEGGASSPTLPSPAAVPGGSATPGGLELHAMHHTSASSSSPPPHGWRPHAAAGAAAGALAPSPTRSRRASVGDRAAVQWAKRRGGRPDGAASDAAASPPSAEQTQLDSLAQMRQLQTMVGRDRARSAGFGLEAAALISVLCDGTRAGVSTRP
jgi:hypothetical protein